jgi:hypothetical protein
MIVISLLMGIVWGVVCGNIATKKHRSQLAWFCTGLFFGLFGVLAASIVKPLPDPHQAWAESVWS